MVHVSALRDDRRRRQRRHVLVALVAVTVMSTLLYSVLGPRHYYSYMTMPEQQQQDGNNAGSSGNVVDHLLVETKKTQAKRVETPANQNNKRKDEDDGKETTNPPKQLEKPKLPINCGNDRRAQSCAECLQEENNGDRPGSCHGDCMLCMKNNQKECVPIAEAYPVNCGGHMAPSCVKCIVGAPPNSPQSWCNGDCSWDLDRNQCEKNPEYVHPAYNSLLGNRAFQGVRTERGEKVNIILVKQPMASHEKGLFQKHKDDILFIGISSFEAYPLSSPNPFSANFSNDEYRGLFPGFLTMMHEPEKYFDTTKTKYLLMSQSDFGVDPGVGFARRYQRNTKLVKKYDFVYSGTDQNVDNDCVGWASFAKNWTFMVEALHVMCSPEFNLTGVLVATKNKPATKACWIPDSCKDKIVQTTFLPNQFEFFNYTIQSHFMIVPQIYDASPRVTSQSLSLNVPILMNRNILGGWKYLNEQTGEFFHDMTDFKQQLRKIVDRSRQGDYYHPQEWITAHYGNEKSGLKFRQWVEKEFPGRVEFPPGSRLLLPWGS